MADILVAPFTGPLCQEIDHQASAYRLGEAVLHPHYFRAELLRHRIAVEMTPTERGAIFRFRRLGSEACACGSFSMARVIGRPPEIPALPGRLRAITWMAWREISACGLRRSSIRRRSKRGREERLRIRVRRGCGPASRMRPGGILFSTEQAGATLDQELIGRTLEAVAAEGEQIWNDLLGRVAFTPRDAEQERLSFPASTAACSSRGSWTSGRRTGGWVHYSPTTARCTKAELCADSGF